jgi:fructokinase
VRIGVDLGGTKIEAIALAGDGGELLRQRIATPRHDYAATLDAIAGLVADFESRLGQRGSVGIGMPGAISPATGLVKNANSTWLNGQPFDHDLSQRLCRPLRFANDANCFALSEASDGAAAGARVVFGVILGTGVGGGIVVDGRVLTGPNAIAGEWGHNPLPWPQDDERPGPACYCGRSGCIETFLSGPALSADHGRAPGLNHVPALEPKRIGQLADREEPGALQTLARYENRLARALASVINLLDPDVIVLGGGLSRFGRFYQNLPALWSRWTFSDRVDTRLVAPKHGDSSGVRGAAWLWARDQAQP